MNRVNGGAGLDDDGCTGVEIPMKQVYSPTWGVFCSVTASFGWGTGEPKKVDGRMRCNAKCNGIREDEKSRARSSQDDNASGLNRPGEIGESGGI